MYPGSGPVPHYTETGQFLCLPINVLPAIRANQYALLTRVNYPVAYCSWANLSLENEIKYLNDVTSLVAEDWTSGDRKWFIDWIAPFGITVPCTNICEKIP